MKKQYLVLALSLAIMAPSLAFADTTATSVTVSSSVSAQIAMLQAQIKSLMAQIEALKNQQGETTSVRWCHDFGANLGVGAKGDEVSALENALSQEGSAGLEHSSNFAASFDERMASAVTGFQEKYRHEILTPNGLKHGTGFVGKSTRAKLNALYGCHPVLPRPTTDTPVISQVSGPTVLSVNQTGTWSVLAYDKDQQTLTYSVNWGDEVSGARVPVTHSALDVAVGSQSTTFTHNYAYAGTYKVSFTVKDSDGNAGHSSITVQVGSITSSGPITVLSPNGSETWYKGSNQTIKWQDNTPVPECASGTGMPCPVYAARGYDIKLAPYYTPCTTSPCPMTAMMYPYRAPHTIAHNIYGTSYNWQVALTIDIDAVGNAPDGSYTIQVCQTGTDRCDSSDSYFKIQTIYTTQSGQ